MAARVHALLVARSGRDARTQLSRTLDALGAQTVPPDAVTLIVTGDVAAVRGDGFPAMVEGVIGT
ncbi:MAG: hypothetical protein WA971_16470, partial [Microbacterium sp.]